MTIRRTRKYIEACHLKNLPHSTSSELYQKLIDMDYYWDANMGRWIFAPGQKNDPPSQQIKIRVWADKNRVQDLADEVIEALAEQGFRCIEKSTLYPCRPPKANEARIYLVFEKF